MFKSAREEGSSVLRRFHGALSLSYETWRAGMPDLRDDVGKLSYCCIPGWLRRNILLDAWRCKVHYLLCTLRI